MFIANWIQHAPVVFRAISSFIHQRNIFACSGLTFLMAGFDTTFVIMVEDVTDKMVKEQLDFVYGVWHCQVYWYSEDWICCYSHSAWRFCRGIPVQVGACRGLSYLWLCVLRWKTQIARPPSGAVTWHGNTGWCGWTCSTLLAQDAIRSSVCRFISTQEEEVPVSIHLVNLMFLYMLFRWCRETFNFSGPRKCWQHNRTNYWLAL